jgi:EAL domain-containing protein (putative c-di-GMP-specific phosphodiesterase class I)
MIELTEDAFVGHSQFQKQVLPMLRELGVRISIDDFGTGYSSLSALADITADELKVDRSFITAIHQRPRSQSVLRAVESLGTSLGMTIVRGIGLSPGHKPHPARPRLLFFQAVLPQRHE